MTTKHAYRKERLSFERRMVRASASVTRQKNTIHAFSEVDITQPRQLIRDYRDRFGERLSFTAYIVASLARTLQDHPQLNSFISGNHIVYLSTLTVSVLVEREIDGERVPESLGIRDCEAKSYLDIHRDIRAAQQRTEEQFGGLSGSSWIRFIPTFLLKTFVRLADRNITMAVRYGKVAVTAVGMFSREPMWLIPHGSATVLVAVGSITDKLVEVDGRLEAREHLCLTMSFDHDIVDGAPAARFTSQFLEEVKSGNLVREAIATTEAAQQ